MKSKIVAAVAAATLTLAAVGITLVTPANAQISGTYTCEARSPSAIGQGINYTAESACARAVAECVARTPYYQSCYITRYWYNY
jgi:hypothetical protein